MKHKIQCSKREKENNSRSNNNKKKMFWCSEWKRQLSSKQKKTDIEIC